MEISPKDRARYGDLARTLRDQGKLDEAIAVYRQAIAAKPDGVGDSWEEIGDILWQQKKLDEAIAAYRQAIDARATHPHWVWKYIGDILLTQGKSHEAIATYQKAIAGERQADPPSRKNLVNEAGLEFDMGNICVEHEIGDRLRKHKKLDEAVAVYRHAITARLNDAGLHHRLGLALRDQNKRAEADAAFDRAIELYRKKPDWTPANRYSLIGVVLRDKGELDEAIAAFRRAFDDNPKRGSVTRDLLKALHAQGRLEDTLDVYRKANEVDPKNFDHHNNFGNALAQLGKLDEAIAVYRKAIEVAPTTKNAAMAYFNLGLALTRQKKVPEAIAAYYRAIEFDQKSYGAKAYGNLGNLLRDWNKPAEAITAFHKAIELDPTIAGFHNNLGAVLCDERKEYDQAIECFRKALELDHKHTGAHRNLGTALGKKARQLRDMKNAGGCLAVAAEYETLKLTDAAYRQYDAACIRALCASAISEDPKTPAADAGRLAREQADLAMAWLHKAVAAGYRDANHIKQDKDLDAVRAREDFKKLMAELEFDKN